VVLELKDIIQTKRRYLVADIPFIDTNYYFLAASIKRLESGTILSSEALEIFDGVKNRIKDITCESGTKIYKKYSDVSEKNPDLEKIRIVNNILNGKKDQNLPDGISPNNLTYLRESILVSVDVERTFSRYRNLLRDDRKSFLFENFKKHLIINCNRSLNKHN
jgi:hypothetical protein